jgi:hypothetical protein
MDDNLVNGSFRVFSSLASSKMPIFSSNLNLFADIADEVPLAYRMQFRMILQGRQTSVSLSTHTRKGPFKMLLVSLVPTCV